MERGTSGDYIATIFSNTPDRKGVNSENRRNKSLDCIYDFAEIITKQDEELQELKKQLESARLDIEKSLENCYIDPLTGCFSVKLYERIKKEQFNPVRDVNKIAIVFIDANGLKEINDTPIELGGGHDAGDEMIKNMSVYLRENFRAEDIVIRPYASGDEFIVICRNHNNNPDFEKLLNKRVRDIRKSAKNKVLSFATGLAVYGIARPDEPYDNDLDDTKKRAEEKMYECKEMMYRHREYK